jgi:hypothetical protein
MPPVISQPREGPLYLPEVLDHLKPRAGVLDYFQINLVRLFAATHPVGQSLRLVASVDPDFA